MTDKRQKLSVLILSPSPQVYGGVSVFIETLKAHLTHTEVTSVCVGSIHDRKEPFLALLWRLVSVPFKVLRHIKRQKIDVVHINPTLDFKSTLRDGLIILVLRLAGFRRVLIFFMVTIPILNMC